MTILIGAAVFFAWAYFWVRGALWAALIVPGSFIVLWLGFLSSPGPFTTNPVHDYSLIAILTAVSMAPMIVAHFRRRKIERTLHGVSFFSRLD